MTTTRSTSSKHGLLPDLVADLGVWAGLVAWLGAFRLLLVVIWAPDATRSDITSALVVGARFDAIIAGVTIIPSLSFAVLRRLVAPFGWVTQVRHGCAAFVVGVTGLFYATDFAFFSAFGDHLDQRVMAILTPSDRASLLHTVWQAHHPILHLCAGLTVGYVAFTSIRQVSQKFAIRLAPLQVSARAEWALSLLMLGFVVVSVRGMSFGRTPIRIRNAFVTANTLLNRAIPSPYAALWHALEDRDQARAPVRRAEFNAALRQQQSKVAREVVEDKPDANAAVAAALSRVAVGTDRPPRHVFVLVLEGQNGFPLLARYRDAALLPELAGLASEGATWPVFIPSGQATDSSLTALIAGVVSNNFNALHEERMLSPLPTSLAPHFARMGYRTRFFYGGYLGWSRLDLALPGQGFSQVLSAASVSGTAGNEWGVWDHHLFDAVLQTVVDDQPSFNVVLTTTNHSPFDLDPVFRRPLPALPAFAAGWDEASLVVLQHEQYVDRVVTNFVRAADAKFSQSLFVIVGDHAAHAAHFGLPNHSLFEATTVPLIMFGSALPEAKRGTFAQPASHLDVAPTLYGLSAPPGFRYVSMGNDLFSATHPHAFGEGTVASDRAVAEVEPDGALRRDPCCTNESGDLTAALTRYRAVTTTSLGLLRGVVE